MDVDVIIRIGGEAGQGMQSIGFAIGKVFTRHGYYTFINQDVESRIRGGHNFVQIRIRNKPVYAIKNELNLLLALNKQTITHDLPYLMDDGVMIFDGPKTGFESDNPNHFSVPLEQLALEIAKNKIMANTVATGAAFALLGFDLEPLLDWLEEEFSSKNSEIIEKNKGCASAGYDYVHEKFRGNRAQKVPPAPLAKKKMLLNGSQAMALGAIFSGLKFYSGYPMSPSTPIMEFIASIAKEYNIIVEPAEDEIAAVNMAIGASFTGVRAMTATSGGGFCLMTEGLGLAGMTETPLVIVNAQRAGPSTGLPTRTEQADLRFVIHASHGEFPRAVFAPGTAEQAFYLMSKAFDMAEKYQTPVVVMGDQHLNDSYFTIDGLDLDQVDINRGSFLSHERIASPKDYRRYAWDESGISPRILPGQTDAVLYADSDEHTEVGHITERADVRKQQMDKRMRKFERMTEEIGPPEVYPETKPDIMLLGWGSTYGAIKEAVDVMNREGIKAQMIHFSEIYPFPSQEFFRKISKNTKIFAVENNFTGQFADLFSSQTGVPVFHKVLKYDGRPFSPQEVVKEVKNSMG
ncbi:MAG: 2-oxoacid:acceptor oxidoreductase subunit alpha [Desulfobacterales bacterium]|nr:2-oxoacid:acceptor oxidoreductase subunit alpha [Desulfobacterales bacterium]